MSKGLLAESGERDVPADLITLRLNLARPHQYPLQDIVRGAQDGWRDGIASGQPRVALRPSPQLPTSTYEVLPDTTQRLLRYREASWGRRASLYLLGAVPGTMSLATALVLMAMGWLAWLIVRNLQLAAPFSPGNTRRIRLLGGLLFGWVVWQQVAHMLLNLIVELPATLLSTALPATRYIHLYDDELVPSLLLLNGFGLLLILYRRGVTLQQEAELTV
ncbi:hypothetical protein [Hymenobacter sp. 102]|uniref:hypothetical protein n=1 Tax=Hymenobacter sp. 102 TaxID=3403152 RepID=UPI003CF38862